MEPKETPRIAKLQLNVDSFLSIKSKKEEMIAVLIVRNQKMGTKDILAVVAQVLKDILQCFYKNVRAGPLYAL